MTFRASGRYRRGEAFAQLPQVEIEAADDGREPSKYRGGPLWRVLATCRFDFGESPRGSRAIFWWKRRMGTAMEITPMRLTERLRAFVRIGWRPERRPVGRMIFPAVALVATASLLAACAGDVESGTGEQPLLVLAAASLNSVMPEIVDSFQIETGTVTQVIYGASGILEAQIDQGAPGDLFFSADLETIERLSTRRAIRPGTARPYAAGELAILRSRNTPPPADPVDLTGEEYRVIAIANPEVAPYGRAARQALERLGIWKDVQGRMVFGGNVAQTLQYVRTGNADVGIVARSLLDPRADAYLAVDPALYDPILQVAGVLETSRHPAAGAFLDFVLSDRGQRILARRGLGPVAERDDH